MMNRKQLIDKIYFKLVGLDFDNLSFTNHIALDEAIKDLKSLREQSENEELPPPLPSECATAQSDNVLPFKKEVAATDLVVMVIDEDVETQALVSYSLKSEYGVEVIMERSPQHALRTIAKNAPDVVMLDILMKEMSCYEFMAHLHRMDRHHKIEIIIGSNNPNQHEKTAAFEMGAADYITRPYDLSEVRFKVKLRLENKRKLCG